MNEKPFQDIYAEARERTSYWTADTIYSFTEELARAMEERHISRSELARRIGTSPAYVTKIMGGDVNFTVSTMVRLADAVGLRIDLNMTSKEKNYTDKKEGQDYLPEVATAKK